MLQVRRSKQFRIPHDWVIDLLLFLEGELMASDMRLCETLELKMGLWLASDSGSKDVRMQGIDAVMDRARGRERAIRVLAGSGGDGGSAR